MIPRLGAQAAEAPQGLQPEHPDGKKSGLPDKLYVVLLEGRITAEKGHVFGLSLGDD
jgi:hypothetical protein